MGYGRLTVRSPKTARHDGHAVRIVPICPELRSILVEALEQAAEGDKLVLQRELTGGSNLRTTCTKIVERAGFTPWPRLFQNLRASCPHAPPQIGRKSRVVRVAATCGEPRQDRLMGGEGLEPPTPSV
jgi:hypothetical protein